MVNPSPAYRKDCPHCGKTLTNLNRHLRSVHGMYIPPYRSAPIAQNGPVTLPPLAALPQATAPVPQGGAFAGPSNAAAPQTTAPVAHGPAALAPHAALPQATAPVTQGGAFARPPNATHSQATAPVSQGDPFAWTPYAAFPYRTTYAPQGGPSARPSNAAPPQPTALVAQGDQVALPPHAALPYRTADVPQGGPYAGPMTTAVARDASLVAQSGTFAGSSSASDPVPPHSEHLMPQLVPSRYTPGDPSYNCPVSGCGISCLTQANLEAHLTENHRSEAISMQSYVPQVGLNDAQNANADNDQGVQGLTDPANPHNDWFQGDLDGIFESLEDIDFSALIDLPEYSWEDYPDYYLLPDDHMDADN